LWSFWYIFPFWYAVPQNLATLVITSHFEFFPYHAFSNYCITVALIVDMYICISNATALEIIGNHWKSLEIIGNHWKSLEIIGNHWKSLEIIGNHWKLLEIIGNHCKSL
jgi:hypothetical protein